MPDKYAQYGGSTELWDKLVRKIGEVAASKAHVKVGILQREGAQVITDEEAEGATVPFTMVELAATHEFGSPSAGIPERSFIRATMRREEDALRTTAVQVATGIIDDKLTIEQGLGLLGAKAATEIRNTIRNSQTEGPQPQANAPATIAAKGSSTPLVDTGRLINAITWQVAKGEDGGGT